VFGKYGERAQVVFEALLEKFADHGVQDIEGAKVLKLPPSDQFASKIQIRVTSLSASSNTPKPFTSWNGDLRTD